MSLNRAGFDYLVIVVYFLAMIAIGFLCSRGKEETTENYLMGGRQMHFVSVGLACMMALLSSVSLVMVPGEIYNNSLTLFIIPTCLSLVMAPLCYMMFVRFYYRLGSFTPYEYLEYRYDAKVRTLIAISAFYARTMYLGMVAFTTAKIFEASYGWNPALSITSISVIGMIYTIKGGAKAVIWTDVLQFFVLFGSFAVVVGLLCWKIDGGAVAAIKTAFQEGHGLPQFRTREFYSISPYVRLLLWLLLYNAIVGPIQNAASDQIAIQRLLSTKSWQDGLKAQCLATGMGFLFMLLLYFVGLAVFTYYHQNPLEMAQGNLVVGSGGDRAFFHFVINNMPAGCSGLFLAGMLAAIMSTLSSGMNSMATVWLKEFHQRFINRQLDAKGEVRVSKLATFCIGLFTIIFGVALHYSGEWLKQSVVEVQTIFNLLGAAILPTFLFAVLSKRTNSTLVWLYTFYAFGEGIAYNLWYILTKNAFHAWQANPAGGVGLAGKLPLCWVVVPLLVGVALLLPWFLRGRQPGMARRSCLLAGGLILGMAEGFLIWYAYSNSMFVGEPLVRSFAFAPPVSLLVACIALRFSPIQPKEKYQGLTLATIKQPILQKKQS